MNSILLAVTVSEWVDGKVAVYFQNIVKRFDGRFKTNLSATPGVGCYVTLTFNNEANYRKFVVHSRILKMKYF